MDLIFLVLYVIYVLLLIYSIFHGCKKIGIFEEPTTMSINLADHTTIQPIEIVEDLLLEVSMFSFHLDFVVINTKRRMVQ